MKKNKKANQPKSSHTSKKPEQAEDSLSLENKRFRAFVENSSDIIVLVNLEGIITYINPAVEKALGFKPEERIGAKGFERVHPDDMKLLIDSFNILATRKNVPPIHGEMRLRHKDGSWRTFEVTGSNLINNNVIETVIVNYRDITDRKKVEEDLHKSEERYRTILEDIKEGYFETNLAGNFTFFNDTVCRALGYTREELMGMSNRSYTDREESEKVYQAYNKVYTTGEPYRDLDWQITRKDGTKRHIEGFISLLKDSSGKPVGFRGITHDITERKKVEETLLIIKRAVESSSDAIGLSDPQGNHVYHNEAFTRLFGYSVEELHFSGGGQAIFVNKNTGKDVFDTIMSGGSWSGEAEFLSKSGSNFLALLRADAIKDDDGKIIGLIGLHTDITESKRTEILIKESEEKYRLLADHMKDQVWLMDLNMKVTYVSPSVERLMGYSFDEIKKMDWANLLTAESLQKATAFVSAELPGALKAPSSYLLFKTLELEFILKDGQKVWGECAFSLIRDETGKAISILGEARNITERKQAEEKLQQTLESLKKAVGTTIQVLVSALEARDPYTSGHQLRSANLACAIAVEMGLSEDQIEAISMAGIIHDIGKLSIPAEILSKPTRLTNLEYSLIKVHPESGYEMLKDVESPWPLAKIVHQHHERMDGTGYPHKLKGNEILIEARILAVADVVEAMASHRPYRASLGIDEAIHEIEKNKGILYDDAVVDACLRLFREKGYHLPDVRNINWP